jgi:tetratricopeptide (TPR) repeat protein
MVPAGGDFTEALSTLENLAQRYPTPHWKAYAYFRRGYLYAWQTKYLEAIAEYSKGIAAEPSDEYSEMGRQHIAQIQKIMEREVLDKLAREKEPLEGKDTPVAASTQEHSPMMSMMFPVGDERLEEGQP